MVIEQNLLDCLRNNCQCMEIFVVSWSQPVVKIREGGVRIRPPQHQFSRQDQTVYIF